MYEVVICTVSSGRVQRKRFASWEAAREYADTWSEKGRRVRVSLERVDPPAPLPLIQTPGRSLAA